MIRIVIVDDDALALTKLKEQTVDKVQQLLGFSTFRTVFLV